MLARFVLGATAWAAAVLLFGAALQHSAPGAQLPRPRAESGLARQLNLEQGNTGPDWRWSVTQARSAVRQMVAEVDAVDVADAMAIARRIVEPRRATFDDILIDVHHAGSPRGLPARRIEWTPRDGFVETAFAPPAP